MRAAQTLTGKANPFPVAPAPTTPVAPKALAFGPFGSNENKVLANLPAQEGKYVNFTISVDTEGDAQCTLDSVIIQDAAGFARKLCGKGTYTVKNFVTPARISFISDAYVNSNSVKLSAITYFDAISQEEQSSSSDVTEEIPSEEPQEEFKTEP